MANIKKMDESLTIEELKDKHGKLFLISVPMSDDTITELVVKKVNRRDFDAGSKILQKNEMQGVEYFLKALTVKGDVEAVIKDFDALRAAAELIIEVITVKVGNVKAL